MIQKQLKQNLEGFWNEKLTSQSTRLIAILAILAVAMVAGVCLTLIIYWQDMRAEQAKVEAELDKEKFLSYSVVMVVPNSLGAKPKRLEVEENTIARGMGEKLKHGIVRFFPKTYSAAAIGGSVPITIEPMSAFIDRTQLPRPLAIDAGEGVVGFQLADMKHALAPGVYDFLFKYSINSVPTMLKNGREHIEWETNDARAVVKHDRIKASIVIPAYARKEDIRMSGWVANYQGSTSGDTSRVITSMGQGEISNFPDRYVLHFSSSRPLSAGEVFKLTADW